MKQRLGIMRHTLGVLVDKPERPALIWMLLGTIVVSLADTASILLVAPLAQAMTGQWRSGSAGYAAELLGTKSQGELVATLGGAVIVGFILKDLLSIVVQWWTLKVSCDLCYKNAIEINEYYLRLPYSKHAYLGLAVILNKSGQNVTLAYTGYLFGIITLVTQIFAVVSVVGALLIAAPLATIILALFVSLFGWLFLRKVRTLNERLGAEELAARERSFKAAFDAFGTIKETQLRNAYDFYLESVAEVEAKRRDITIQKGVISSLPKQLIEIVFMLALAIVFAFVSFFGGSQSLLSSMAVLLAAAFRVLPTAAAMLGTLTTIRHAESATRDFIASKQAARSQREHMQIVSRDEVTPLVLRKELEVRDVHFRYDDDAPEVLKGVDLHIPFGTKAAFVGSSGAGKSTLLDLLMGLQVPTSGEILIDGADMRENIYGWQSNIGVVPQKVFITDRTIAENIAFDQRREDIDPERVREALEGARLWEFVSSQPEGIWSEFGEQGRRLSGGQLQRVGIARALYRRPNLLILDEATSALDNETEAEIAETIDNLSGKITVIIVAHRLSTIRNADQIVFLANGVVDGVGSFTELQERSEGFRNLVKLAALEQA
ncbi:MAG: ABC transporter ATP-binding protein [Actinomyces graevenitzii]|jgi:ATPase|nr:ABC transporter ATP-binding protein [Actinomyces graevenitzii]